MICKECGKTEPESRWNERFGKHELCEKCLRDHEHFKYEYISHVLKQARIKDSCGFLTVKVLPRDSHEIITIIEEQLFDIMDFGMLIDEIEDVLKDDIFPTCLYSSDAVCYTICKPEFNGKELRLGNSEIRNLIEAFFNSDAIVSIEYSSYPKKERF